MIIIDPHTHIYDCYDLRRFFDYAIANLSKNAPSRHGGLAIVLLEKKNLGWFERLRMNEFSEQIHPFSISKTESDAEIKIRNEEDELMIIPGIQYISSERIEVLGIGSRNDYQNQPVSKLINLVNSDGGFPILPWGVGKWIGERGRIILDLLQQKENNFCLGDNRGRLRQLPLPNQFKMAKQRNIAILPGSDPLPIAGQEQNAGSAGIVCENMDTNKPILPQFISLLRENQLKFTGFSKHSSIVEFIKNQILIRK